MFSEKLAGRAVRDLESLGVQVWTNSRVSSLDVSGVSVESENLQASTVLWAAGVKASALNQQLEGELDHQGRVRIGPDLSLPDHPNVFVLGDQAHCPGKDGRPLPGVAPAAMQQGAYVAQRLRRLIESGNSEKPIEGEVGGTEQDAFVYHDKGQLATIGRRRAILQTGKIQLTGFAAWVAWLVVHIYYLVGFKNRLLVVIQWAWAYLTFRRGARLIVDREWRLYSDSETDSANARAAVPSPESSESASESE